MDLSKFLKILLVLLSIVLFEITQLLYKYSICWELICSNTLEAISLYKINNWRMSVWLEWHLFFQQSDNTWEDLRAGVGGIRALVCSGERARPGHGCLLHSCTADERVRQSTRSNPQRVALAHKMTIPLLLPPPSSRWTKQKYHTCVLLIAYDRKVTVEIEGRRGWCSDFVRLLTLTNTEGNEAEGRDEARSSFSRAHARMKVFMRKLLFISCLSPKGICCGLIGLYLPVF